MCWRKKRSHAVCMRIPAANRSHTQRRDLSSRRHAIPAKQRVALPSMSSAEIPQWVVHRPKLVLFGDSLTERGFEAGGWASSLAYLYTRKADVISRGGGAWIAWSGFVGWPLA